MRRTQGLLQTAFVFCLLCLTAILAYTLGGLNSPAAGAGGSQGCSGGRIRLAAQQPGQQHHKAAVAAAGAGGSVLVGQLPTVVAQTVPLACEDLLPPGSLSTAYHFQHPGGNDIAFTDERNMTIIRTNLQGEAKRTAVQDVLAHYLVRGCPQPGQPVTAAPKLFVDVGSNVGWFSVMGAVHGCQVLLFDPQPICVATIRRHLCLNRQYPLISTPGGVAIVNHPVSNVSGTRVTMSVPDYCAQAFNVDAGLQVAKRHQGKRKIERSSHTSTTVSVDDLLLDSGFEAFLLKIDVEGYEGAVLDSIRGLVAAGRVRRLLIELTPGFWSRDGISKARMVEALLPLLQHGCVIQRVLDLELPEAGAAAGSDLDSIVDWTAVIDSEEKLQQYITVDLTSQEDIFVLCQDGEAARQQ